MHRISWFFVVMALLPACKRGASSAGEAATSEPERSPTVLLFPSAGNKDDGVWARGCARLMARQIDRAAGRDTAVVALVVGVKQTGVGWVLPSAPVQLDEARQVARKYGAPLLARVHLHSPSSDYENILMDVFDADKLETRFSRVYPWNPHHDLPPLRSATIDLAHAAGIAVDDQALLDDAPFLQTSNAAALEALLGYLDNLWLGVAAQGRPLGPSYRPPHELLDAALTADPGFGTARALKEAGLAARFDRVRVVERMLRE